MKKGRRNRPFGISDRMKCKVICAKQALASDRTDHHNHLTTLHLGHVLNLAQSVNVTRNTLKQFTAQVLVRHLTAAKAQRDLDLVTVL